MLGAGGVRPEWRQARNKVERMVQGLQNQVTELRNVHDSESARTGHQGRRGGVVVGEA